MIDIILFIVLLIVIITVSLGWGVYRRFYFTASGTTATPLPFNYSETPSGWTAIGTPGPCQLYTFPSSIDPRTQMVTVGIPTLYYPDPSLPSPFNNLEPLPPTPCFDEDQIIVQTLQRQCKIFDPRFPNPPLTMCINQNGTRSKVGDIETYNAVCHGDYYSCYGSVGILLINYYNRNNFTQIGLKLTFTPPNTYSLSVTLNNEISVDDFSLFRVSRMQIGQATESQDQSGPLYQFYSREAGACLYPVSNTVGATLQAVGCTDSYQWAMIPSISWDSSKPAAPIQLAYIGGVTITSPLATVTDLKKFITDNNILVLSIDNDSLTLQPYVKEQGTVIINGNTMLDNRNVVTFVALRDINNFIMLSPE